MISFPILNFRSKIYRDFIYIIFSTNSMQKNGVSNEWRREKLSNLGTMKKIQMALRRRHQKNLLSVVEAVGFSLFPSHFCDRFQLAALRWNCLMHGQRHQHIECCCHHWPLLLLLFVERQLDRLQCCSGDVQLHFWRAICWTTMEKPAATGLKGVQAFETNWSVGSATANSSKSHSAVVLRCSGLAPTMTTSFSGVVLSETSKFDQAFRPQISARQ